MPAAPAPSLACLLPRVPFVPFMSPLLTWAAGIRRFHSHLAEAVEAQGGPPPVLQAFAAHLREHLLTPSGRGGDHRKARALSPSAGGYTYAPLPGVVWEAKAEGRNLRKRRGCYQSNRVCGPIQGDMRTNYKVQRPEAEARSRRSEDGRRRAEDRGAAAVGYLSRFLCVGFALALLVTGCVGHRELLAAIDRQATRTNAVESGLARVTASGKVPYPQASVSVPVGFALLLCCASFILGPSSTMRFDTDTQNLTAGGAQQTALSKRVAEATAPRVGRGVFMGEAITPNPRMPG